MPRYVALFRGINVGGNHMIPMSELRELCACVLGAQNVQSYIASGNLVFNTDLAIGDIENQLCRAIKVKYGFEIAIVLLSQSAFGAVLTACPFPDGQGNKVHAYLCLRDPIVDQSKIDCLKAANEQIAIIDRTVWLFAPDGMGRSQLAGKMESCIGTATARNLNTMRKIGQMLEVS
ncbi:DUF1697 domain-containing protein [Loktanella sp. S4079]|uniref:DUF1697 domain-containing protein n=1 Tax=Loktanella sp. S4079 TaxID=579483 RepID=UPI0005FA3162|nr:DUF1697 domain-containing protein [Loktanella sp. S4079]KJZ19999.1 hypothetical protein TW80_03875 [Loktanella sp. S4079]